MKTIDEVGRSARLAFISSAVERSRQVRYPGVQPAALTASAAPPAPAKIATADPAPAPRAKRGVQIEPTQQDYDRVRLCLHEAGHAVAGVLLGGELFSAAVVASKTLGLQGTTKFAELASAHDGGVAFAGPWVEARWSAGRRPDSWEVAAALTASCAHGGLKSDQAIVAAAGGAAAVSSDLAGLLDRCWPAVVRVAEKLIRNGEAVHEDVCAALGLSDDRSRHSFEIANIHAGMRGVPSGRG